MVRHKTRWLLVQLDFGEDVSVEKAKKLRQKYSPFPSKKETTFFLRQNIVSCFGVAADGAALDLQVRFVDPGTRLILIRVAREFCSLVRASLSLLTFIGTLSNGRAEVTGPPNVVASVLSVNGSARTAKLATMSRLRKIHQGMLRLDLSKGGHNDAGDLEALLSLVQNID